MIANSPCVSDICNLSCPRAMTSIQGKDNKLNSIYFSFLQNQIKICIETKKTVNPTILRSTKMCQIDTILFGYLANCQ